MFCVYLIGLLLIAETNTRYDINFLLFSGRLTWKTLSWQLSRWIESFTRLVKGPACISSLTSTAPRCDTTQVKELYLLSVLFPSLSFKLSKSLQSKVQTIFGLEKINFRSKQKQNSPYSCLVKTNCTTGTER